MTFRVLLIDDDARLFELLQSYLGPNGVHLTNAPDGQKGLQLLETQVFDAVLLDVMMPGIDGLEVCRRIRARSNVPVIMLTARGDETDRVVGLEIGADDYLPKPFSPRELLARMRAVLRRASPEAVSEKLNLANIQIDVGKREVR
ncbi:MAG TPA: response regulator, partial [Myxococcales bacterium]|nr:response regulator [Myxococcales bacterium]